MRYSYGGKGVQQVKKKIISICLVLAIVATCIIAVLLNDENETVISYGLKGGNIEFSNAGEDITEKISSGDYIVAQNSNFTMLIDENANISIKDNIGNIWNAVPENGMEFNEKYGSSVAIKYGYSTSTETNLFSMTDSVKNKQFKVYSTENGVRVEYIMGEKPIEFVYPEYMTVKRYKELKAKMKPEDAEFFEEAYNLFEREYMDKESIEVLASEYPLFKEHDIYITEIYVRNQKKKLSEIFTSIGYTSQDREKDMGVNDGEIEHSKTFLIPVDYSLTEKGFEASIDIEKCKFYQEYPIFNIDLLPFFDAYSSDETGYILFPSGSGALIDIEGKINEEETVKTTVYGKDSAISQETTLYGEECPLPYFGAYKDGKGYLCVLSEGAQQASIEATKASDFSRISASFMPIDKAVYKMDSSNNVNLYADELAVSKVKEEFILLSDIDSDNAYSKMAEIYREKLVNDGVLEKKQSSGVTLLAEFPMVINYDDLIMGSVPVNREFALSTFDDVLKVANKLNKTVDSENLKILISGWNKKGIDREKLGSWNYSKVAGGKKGFDALTKGLEKANINLFVDINMNLIKPHNGDAFASTEQAARAINNKIVSVKDYNIHTNRFETTGYQLLSPKHYLDIFKKYDKKQNKEIGFSVSEFSEMLYADYAKGVSLNRGEVINEISDALNQDGERNIIGNSANDYSIPYIDLITDLPTVSAEKNIFDRNIPFIQMVLHGYKDYVSVELNGKSDIQKELLKLIETGSGMQYHLTNNYFEKLGETDFVYLYNTDFSKFEEQLISGYEYVNKALNGLGNQEIKAHTYIADDVVKVTYSSGTTIYINYSDSNFSVDGNEISANSYLRID